MCISLVMICFFLSQITAFSLKNGSNFISSSDKQLTIWGYRISEIVANNVYNFVPIPGRYDGCVEVTSDTKLML
jgi:hypothetical protein